MTKFALHLALVVLVLGLVGCGSVQVPVCRYQDDAPRAKRGECQYLGASPREIELRFSFSFGEEKWLLLPDGGTREPVVTNDGWEHRTYKVGDGYIVDTVVVNEYHGESLVDYQMYVVGSKTVRGCHLMSNAKQVDEDGWPRWVIRADDLHVAEFDLKNPRCKEIF